MCPLQTGGTGFERRETSCWVPSVGEVSCPAAQTLLLKLMDRPPHGLRTGLGLRVGLRVRGRHCQQMCVGLGLAAAETIVHLTYQ